MFIQKTSTPYYMLESHIKLVKDTWFNVVCHATEAGGIFYEKFFELEPNARALFKEDIQQQKHKLVMAISVIFTKVHKLDHIEEEVKFLAKRHVHYGVDVAFFRSFRTAFLSMLQIILSEQNQWNREVETAWESIYDTITQAIIKIMQAEQLAKVKK
ncbi:MAG TPA: hypothetical protein DCM08_12705 [Microscillaceae bacterium]|nr:hypothetical protein [Microscillaceae bacterium]